MRKLFSFLALLSGSVFNGSSSIAQQGIINTIAGGGTSTSDGVPATTATFSTASGNWPDSLGNIYIR